jgi:hypothetical protein
MLQPDDVVREFSKVLVENRGSVFIGAGISTPSGTPSWAQLLSSMARTRLNLEIVPSDDLPLIAQHIVNQAGTRGPLAAHFRDQLDRPFVPNVYHTALARTNLKRLWTTNYDTILEDTFGRHFNVKVRASDESMSRGGSEPDVEIIKMHGCIRVSEADDLVITQEDYEDFFERRPATAHRLRQDLLDRQFLFIGYSYADMNIRNIVVEARRLGKRSLPQHYIVLQRPQESDGGNTAAKRKRQELWLADLSRLGIAACEIDDFSQLQTILEKIALRSRGDTVFVTGSHLREEPASQCSPGLLGALLASEAGLVLLDGQSSGTGRQVTTAYMETCLQNRVDLTNRLRLFANPYAANPRFSDDPTLLSTLKDLRSPLMRSAQVVVVYPGGMGTDAEVQLAKELGCQIVPVPETEGDLPSQLLADPVIRTHLQAIAPEYLAKAGARSVCAPDVAACVRRMLGK